MKQTIEIEVPDGKKAVWEDGTLKFIDDGPTMPKTWKEFCKVHPLQPTDTIINANCSLFPCYLRLGMQRRKNEDRNYLPTQEPDEAHLALVQLYLLSDCYRRGWVPNWNDINQVKWCIIQAGEGIFKVDYCYTYIKFLSFPTRKLAEEFLRNFRDLIEQAGDLI